MKLIFRSICFILVFAFLAGNGFAQQKMDQEYAKLIKKYTTSPDYLNELVDHLPASSTVPSPLEYFGTIAGAADTLHYTAEIYGYMRALDEASPRVVVHNIGKTEEGRDMIVVLIADSKTIQNLDTYQKYLNQLSDPRTIDPETAKELIGKAKPVYFFTAGLHSPETGSPEMVTELAYRLAVEDSPIINKIRNNVIVAISPVTEPDGRDRVVDIYNWRDANGGVTPHLTYWGHYVAHDNNRDGYGLALNLTNNILDFYLKWTPTVMHDLHESVAFMYVSTGMGPYNPYYDATLVNDWYKLAFNDVDALTRRGMPGVWTWGFYNGWGFNFLFSIANVRNSVGRFYETYGNSIPQTVTRYIPRASSREWYRTNPPLAKTKWSLRNNVNYQQTGALAALHYTAKNSKVLLKNFYRRSKKAIKEGKTKAPYAFVIPKKQQKDNAVVRLINLLRKQGIEVHQTDNSIAWPDGKASNGAYIVRMDQPYRTLVGNLLGVQKFPSERYEPPYDDVGWTLPYLYGIQSYKIDDPAILKEKMTLLTHDVQLQGKVTNENSAYLLLDNTAVSQIGMFRLQLPDVPMQISEASFDTDDSQFAPGSLVITTDNLNASQLDKVKQKAIELGLHLFGVSQLPDVPFHDAEIPSIALVHTWIPTPQNAGWWRLALDKLNIPYHLISTQDFRNMDPSEYDVIIMPDTRGNTQLLVTGAAKAGPPIPWINTMLTPNIGKIDHTKDQRQGMGYEGVQLLTQFIRNGGVFITEASSSSLPIDLGITRHISIQQTPELVTHGSIFKAAITDSTSPITYGYPDTMAVYFNQRPVFYADTAVGSYRSFRTPDSVKDKLWKQTYPRVVMRFEENTSELLLSRMMEGGEALAGTPAVVDVPVGEGHVVMFAPHVFWRWETHGSHALVFNTLMNWNDLRTGWPERPTEEKSNVTNNRGYF